MRRLASIEGAKVVIVIRHPLRGFLSHYDSVGCRAIITFEKFVESNATDCVPGRNWEMWSARIKRLLGMMPAERIHLVTIGEASSEGGFKRLVKFITRGNGRILPETRAWTQRRNVGVGNDEI